MLLLRVSARHTGMRPVGGPETKAKLTKVFWLFFSKKNKKKRFFLKKEAKTFVNCSLFADVGWSGRWRFSNAIASGAEPPGLPLARRAA
ncbi:MAG: hypothetical protein WDN04_04235 [Rhodospirillales bacterium]